MVLQRREIAVPNTSIVLKSYDISFSRKEAITDKEIRTVEENVKADRLRLLVDKNDVVDSNTNTSKYENETNANHNDTSSLTGQYTYTGGLLSENAGGGWQTVTVEVIDEEEELANEVLRQKEDAEIKKKENNVRSSYF